MKTHDTIATRLALILSKLNAGERFTVESLCDEFGVTARTIQTPRVRTQTTNHHKNTLLPFNPHFLTEHNKQYKTVSSPYGDTGFIHCVHKTNLP